MSERPVELQAILAEIRRRWTRRSLLRAAALGASAAAVVILAGWIAAALLAREGLPLLTVVIVVLTVAVFALARALWTTRGRPTDGQVARLIEERDCGLDDVLVTAVEYEGRADASPRMRHALFADAERALTARNLPLELDRIISRVTVRRAALGAVAAAVALALAAAVFAPSLNRATRVASAYVFPGGAAEENEDARTAAARELFEEAGVLLAKQAAGDSETLEFMSQEIAREFNTIGSKANDVEISQLVVTCKAELEKVREQLSNIE